MKRRTFLTLLTAAGGTCSVPNKVAAALSVKAQSDGFGVLHDTSLCIGCRKCEEACASFNKLPQQNYDDFDVLDKERRTSAYDWTVVNKYMHNSKTVFRKQQCNHCNEPACANACLSGAFKKESSGVVSYDASICVGCRYCIIACPYSIPGYEYTEALNPLVQKCTMCKDRLKDGKIPACIEICPTGALVFGKRSELLQLAKKRLLEDVSYVQHVYGEREMGGSAWLYISKQEFKYLGMNENLGTKAASEYTQDALETVPFIAGFLPVVLGGAYAITKLCQNEAEHEKMEAVNMATEKVKEEADLKLEKELEIQKEKALKAYRERLQKRGITEQMLRDAVDKLPVLDYPKISKESPSKEKSTKATSEVKSSTANKAKPKNQSGKAKTVSRDKKENK